MVSNTSVNFNDTSLASSSKSQDTYKIIKTFEHFPDFHWTVVIVSLLPISVSLDFLQVLLHFFSYVIAGQIIQCFCEHNCHTNVVQNIQLRLFCIQGDIFCQDLAFLSMFNVFTIGFKVKMLLWSDICEETIDKMQVIAMFLLISQVDFFYFEVFLGKWCRTCTIVDHNVKKIVSILKIVAEL